VRDAVVAVAAGLVAAGVALSIAFGLLEAYRMPLHYGYGLVLGIIIVGGALAGPRDRTGWMITGAIALAWLLGTGYLYSVRDQIHLRPEGHHGRATVVFEPGPG